MVFFAPYWWVGIEEGGAVGVGWGRIGLDPRLKAVCSPEGW